MAKNPSRIDEFLLRRRRSEMMLKNKSAVIYGVGSEIEIRPFESTHENDISASDWIAVAEPVLI